MNLDDPQLLNPTENHILLGSYSFWSSELLRYWEQGLASPLPDQTWGGFRTIVVAGWGEAVTPAMVLRDLFQETSPIQIVILQQSSLPAWMTRQCLLVLVSPDGETPEIFDLQTQAKQRHIPSIVITKQNEGRFKVPIVWEAPPAAKAYSFDWIFCFLLALHDRLAGTDNRKALQAAGDYIAKSVAPLYDYRNIAATNPAKRQAGQFIERLPVIVGGGIFSGVAYRWKARLNTVAQSWAGYEAMPEANFNTVNAMDLPAFLIPKVIGMFIRSKEYENPLLSKRYDLTLQLLLEKGVGTDSFYPSGPNPIAQVLHAVLYSDYVSFYAGIAADSQFHAFNLQRYSNAITHFLKEAPFTP